MTERCAARVQAICAGIADHRHHRQLRRFGDHSNSNLLPVCFACHEHIHRNPAWARSWGLLVSSWEMPAEIQPQAFADPGQTGPLGASQ